MRAISLLQLSSKIDWAEWLGGCPIPPSALHVSVSQIYVLLWREQPFSKQDFRREFVSSCTPLLESPNRLSSHHSLLLQKCTVRTFLTPISVEASLNMVQQAPKGPWTRCQATLRTQWPNLKTINYVSLLVSFNNRLGEGAETRQEQPTAYSYLLLTPGFSFTTPSPGCYSFPNASKFCVASRHSRSHSLPKHHRICGLERTLFPM